MDFEVISVEQLESVDGGRSEGLMGAVRVGLVGLSLATGNPEIKAPRVEPLQPSFTQDYRVGMTQK